MTWILMIVSNIIERKENLHVRLKELSHKCVIFYIITKIKDIF